MENNPDSNTIMEVIAVNGHAYPSGVLDTNEVRKIIEGKYAYKLNQGEHTLIVRVWERDFYINLHDSRRFRSIKKRSNPTSFRLLNAYKENNYYNNHSSGVKYKRNQELLSEVIKEYPINVKISNNGVYRLNSTNIDGKIKFSLTLEQQPECSFQKNVNYRAEYHTVTEELPSALENRLNNLMYLLEKHYKKSGLPTSNIISAGFYQYFGAVLSKQKIKSDAYQVLSVQPFSLAYRMGLVSGDYITSFGDKRVNGEYEKANLVLMDYLRSIEQNSDVKLTILRNEKQRLLTHAFVTPIIPQTSYEIMPTAYSDDKAEIATASLTQNIAMPIELSFVYDQLMLEIKQHFKNELIKNNIEIIRPANKSKKYGLQGQIVKNNEIDSLLVTYIDSGSSAEKMGLETDDIIQAINGRGIENSFKPFSAVIQSLEEGDIHTIEITRAGKKLILEGKYNTEVTPAYSLRIMSLEKMAKLRQKLKRPRRFAKFKSNDPFSNLHSENNSGYQRDLESRSSSNFRNGIGPRGKNNSKSNN
ncbi:MAG: PDZ domain-containing protein [Flavobacteriaceae bacterium]|nr:PDZ domain-containing protein [Flavobacteriaceae bacterium]